MAEIRCPMCGKNNPSDQENCQFCEARLVPLAPGLPSDETPVFSTEPGSAPEEPEDRPGTGDGWLDDLRSDETGDDFVPQEDDELDADPQDWLSRLESDEPQPPVEEPSVPEPAAEDASRPASFSETPIAGEAQPNLEEDLPDWLKSIEAQPMGEEVGKESDEATETQEIPGMVFKETGESDAEADPDWLSPQDTDAPDEPPLEGTSHEDEVVGLPSDFETIDIPGLAMAAAQSEAEEPHPVEEETPAEAADLPDWLSEQAETPVAPQAESPAEEGDLPAWLSEGTSEDALELESAAEFEEASGVSPEDEQDLGDKTPDWLQEEEEAEAGEISDWLSDAAPAAPAEALGDALDLPEESGEPAEETPAVEPGEVPDWPSDAAPAAAAAAAADAAFELPEESREPAEETPAVEPGEVPDWLVGDAPEQAPAAETSDVDEMFVSVEPGEEPLSAEPGELPDWLSDEAPDEAIPTSEVSEPQGIVESTETEEELEIEAGELPDWLSDEAPAAAVIAAGEGLEEPPEPSAESDAEVGEIPGWLEDEPKEEDSGELPDWLKAGASAAAVGAAAKALGRDDEPEDIKSEEAPVEEEAGELPEWLQQEQDAGSWEVEAEVPPPGKTEENLDPADVSEAEELSEAVAAGEEPGEWPGAVEGQADAELPLSLDEEDVPDWLKSLQTAQQDAGEGTSVGDLEDLQAPTEDPAEMVEEGEVPDWLEELSFAVPAVAVEAGGGEEFESVEGPVDSAEAQPDIPEGGDVETILPGVLQDAFDDSEDMEISPEDMEGDDDLEPADLPGWLKAMRPVEAVAAVSPFIEEGEPGQSVEGAGPLAGLQGVLPAEPDISQAGGSSMVSTRVDVTKNQYDHVALLRGIVKEEAEPSPYEEKRPFIQPGHVLRWIIAVGLIAFLALPLITGGGGVSQPTFVPDETIAVNQIISGLQPGQPVLVAFDYQPGLSGEMGAVADSVFQDLLSRQVLLTIVSTSPTGPALGEEFLAESGPAGDFGYEHGQDYINLGYIPGGAGGLQFFGLNPQATLQVPFNYSGGFEQDPYSIWSSPPLAGITTLSDYAMALVITDDAGLARAWVEQVGVHLAATPLLMVASGQAAPLIRPYYETSPRQVDGLVSGLVGGISYQQATGGGSVAGTYWEAYNNGILIAILLIIAGGLYGTVASLLRLRKEESEPKSEPKTDQAEPQSEEES